MMSLGIVLSAVDMFSKPLANMGNNVSNIGSKLKNIKLDNINKDITVLDEKLQKLNNIKLNLKEKLTPLTQNSKSMVLKLKDLDKELKELSKTKLDLSKDFKKGKISAEELDNKLKDVDNSILKLNNKKTNITNEFKKNEKEVDKVNSEIERTSNLIDKLSNKKTGLKTKFTQIENKIMLANKRLKDFSANLVKISTVALAVGSAITAPFKSMINSYQEVQKAQGDIASLGIDDNGIKKITKAAKDMSNQYAGITAPGFIKASYDIKSGIASLSDEGVAKFTKLAAMTGQATKSSTEGMTKLFALGYGIFKNKTETDFDFGKRLSSNIAQAVKAFRTDGSDLTLGISNIGAMAKTFGVSLSEELSIIGNAKGAFESAAEAGTGYRAFLGNAVKAQKTLGLTFTDTQGKLLPMVNILEKVKAKYGKTLNANNMAELKKAFGSEEAVKIITALYNKTDDLKKSQKELKNSTLDNVKAMALARNKGKEFEVLSQRISNLASTFGKLLAPAVNFASDKIGELAMWLSKVAESSSFVKYIFYAVAGLGTLAVILGTVGIALSATITGITFFTSALSIASIKTKALSFWTGVLNTKARLLSVFQTIAGFLRSFSLVTSIATAKQWLLNIALDANPIGLIIVAIGALVAGLIWAYNKFDWFRNGLGLVWNGIKKGADFIKNVFLHPVNVIQNAWHKLIGWIKSKIEWISNTAKKIKNFFSFGSSDDKEKTDTKESKSSTIKKVVATTAVMANMANATPIIKPVNLKTPATMVEYKIKPLTMLSPKLQTVPVSSFQNTTQTAVNNKNINSSQAQTIMYQFHFGDIKIEAKDGKIDEHSLKAQIENVLKEIDFEHKQRSLSDVM